MRKICCNCKKESKEFNGNSNIGEIMKVTNFNAVFNMDMKSFWLCKECSIIADAKAKELISMFNNEDITLGLMLIK